jgi:UDP-N-acetylmuramate dehydrogenase
MNAGTAHRWVHDCVQRVEVLTPGALEPQWLAAEDYSAVYRDGGLPAGTWYLRAEFRLKRGEPEQLQATARELKAHKAASQPLAAQSAGCIFKNPSPTMPAGKLLDELGCKNWQIGAARLSEQHANFIVNDGGALAQDVVRLIQQLRRHAWHERGVVLHCEVQRWLPDDPLDCHPSDIAAEQVRGHYAD